MSEEILISSFVNVHSNFAVKVLNVNAIWINCDILAQVYNDKNVDDICWPGPRPNINSSIKYMAHNNNIQN